MSTFSINNKIQIPFEVSEKIREGRILKDRNYSLYFFLKF